MRSMLWPLVLVGIAALLSACGTTRRLPTYEPPLAHTPVQTVRMTAYTETEADHLEYGARNALGGILQAASAPAPPMILAARPVVQSPPLPNAGGGGFQRTAYVPTAPAVSIAPVRYGSAAADWSRWPAGTTFRIVSTGQLYRVDDYGWALSGRNTIDLYMPSRAAMNGWGLRRETIQILQWADPHESLQILRPRGKYRHLHRMILELEGKNRAAANLD